MQSPGNNLIRILLIEDHAIFRHGVRLILEETAGMVVVGEATTGGEGLEQFTRLRGDVDVVISDLALPDMSGLEVLRQIKQQQPTAQVILLTMHNDEEHIRGMIEIGVDGYVLKQVAVEELIGAIHTVRRGETALSPLVTRQLLQQMQSGRGRERPVATLTARERQILHLLSEGLTSKEIAAQLGLSANTIDNHRARILVKLGVSNTAAAIRLAARQGAIPQAQHGEGLNAPL